MKYIKNKKLIFIVTYLAYTAIYIARVNLSMAGPELKNLQLIDEVQLGILGSLFSTIYATGRLINGGLSDKKTPWFMLTTGLAIAGVANILISFLPGFIGILVLWTANAYAQSMLWSSVLCVVSALYETKEAKKKTSLMVTSVALGNIIGILINSLLIEKLGVKFAFVVPGILTLILGIIICIVVRDIPVPEPKTDKKHIAFHELLKNREILTMGVPAVMHGVMKENISLWMAVYIVDKFSVDLTVSSYYILLIPLIGFVGRIAYSLFYNLCGEKENKVSGVGFLICIIAALILCIGNVGMVTEVLCLSLIYAAASVINTSMLSIFPLRYTKTGNVASVSGIMDFATYLGGGITGVIYGVVIRHLGYTPMFVSWIVISVISMFMLWKISEPEK